MAGKELGEKIRAHREAREWSRAELETRSGVAASTIENYEGPTPPARPTRRTVTSLAVAFGWDVDETLRLAGLPPLTDVQRELLAPAVDLRAVLDRLWPRLTPRQQAAVVELAAAVVEPQGSGVVLPGPRDDGGGGLLGDPQTVVMDTSIEAAGRESVGHRSRQGC